VCRKEHSRTYEPARLGLSPGLNILYLVCTVFYILEKYMLENSLSPKSFLTNAIALGLGWRS
jgi:hypothetical protein